MGNAKNTTGPPHPTLAFISVGNKIKQYDLKVCHSATEFQSCDLDVWGLQIGYKAEENNLNNDKTW